jgi:hypothetical protein
MAKNPRGPPRLLYQAVFDDTMNVYDFQSRGELTRRRSQRGARDDDDDDDGRNLTRLPMVGDRLFVLGSNEEISVGQITSVAQPSSTGEACIVCLALVRRADSILKQMKQADLRISRPPLMVDGIIDPPPLDPLDGLEVIIGGTFTIGKLVMVPMRRARNKQRLYVNDVPEFVQNLPKDDDDDNDVAVDFASRTVQDPVNYKNHMNDDDDDDVDTTAAAVAATAELNKAMAEAEAAAVEAKRKEEKLKVLLQRAEEAMARRNNKRAQQQQQQGGSEEQ